jgi:hypothetical protein
VVPTHIVVVIFIIVIIVVCFGFFLLFGRVVVVVGSCGRLLAFDLAALGLVVVAALQHVGHVDEPLVVHLHPLLALLVLGLDPAPTSHHHHHPSTTCYIKHPTNRQHTDVVKAWVEGVG